MDWIVFCSSFCTLPPRQPASQPVIRAVYSPSLCPLFGNHPGLPYPDKVLSKRGRPHPADRVSFPCRGILRLSPESVPKASLVHGHFDPADPILLNGLNIYLMRTIKQNPCVS